MDTQLESQHGSSATSRWSFSVSVLMCTHIRVKESFWVRYVAVEDVAMVRLKISPHTDWPGMHGQACPFCDHMLLFQIILLTFSSVHDLPWHQEAQTDAYGGRDSACSGAAVSPINMWDFVQNSATAANCKFSYSYSYYCLSSQLLVHTFMPSCLEAKTRERREKSSWV